MSQYLPADRFEWLKNVDKPPVNKVCKDSSKGFILEVNVKFLNILKNYNDYPLAHGKNEVKESMYQLIVEKLQISIRI